MSIASEITKLQTAKAALKTSIEGKGVTVPSSAKLDSYSTYVDSIEQGGGGNVSSSENDVNFIDYDGTIVDSYSAADFANLTALPNNPDHTSENLISNGWNWTLTDAKTYVSNNGGLKIGQTYYTTNGSTYIKIDTLYWGKSVPITLTFTQSVANGVTIDFGDGTASTTVNSTSVSLRHIYKGGNVYTISLTPIGSCKITIAGDSTNGCKLLGTSNYYLKNSIIGVFIGKQVSVGTYAFKNCLHLQYFGISPNVGNNVGGYDCFNGTYDLKCIVAPNNIRFGSRTFGSSYINNIVLGSSITLDTELFINCYGLKTIYIPKMIIPRGLFYGCTNLTKIVIPEGTTVTNNSVFDSCKSIQCIIYPSSMTSIGGNMLTNVTTGIIEIIIKANTPPTLYDASTSLGGTSLTFPIYVPDSAVETYKSAYTNYASRIKGISERPQ